MKATTPARFEPGAFLTPTVKLLRPLAEGGMGRVWIAEHLGLNTQVVVKLMADEMAARPDGAERFAREAAAAAAIKSPHVVQVFDHGMTTDGVPYIVMELLEGRDLGAYLNERGRMDPIDAATLVVQIGKVLAKAHKAGIVHRDIKPDNIFLCDTDGGEMHVKLLDFGTAKKDEGAPSKTTVPGQIMGTPYYMSPEQSVAGEIDERSDIWSLGVVVFEALTGRRPFDGGTLGAITMAIHGVLPKMTAYVPDLPPKVDAWFAHACAQLPQNRFSNVREAVVGFVEAITGVAAVDQATESIALPSVQPKQPPRMVIRPSNPPVANTKVTTISEPPHFPPPRNDGSSTPVRPLAHSIKPLSAELPQRSTSRTTTAMAIVMGVAAIAMAAIIIHRPSSSSTAAQAETTSAAQQTPTPHADPPPPPAPPTPPAEPEPSQPVVAQAKKAAQAKAPVAAGAPAQKPLQNAHAVTKPSATPSAASAKPAPSNPDDDLLRLQKAAEKAEKPEAPKPEAAKPEAPKPAEPKPAEPKPEAPKPAEPPPLPPN